VLAGLGGGIMQYLVSWRRRSALLPARLADGSKILCLNLENSCTDFIGVLQAPVLLRGSTPSADGVYAAVSASLPCYVSGPEGFSLRCVYTTPDRNECSFH